MRYNELVSKKILSLHFIKNITMKFSKCLVLSLLFFVLGNVYSQDSIVAQSASTAAGVMQRQLGHLSWQTGEKIPKMELSTLLDATQYKRYRVSHNCFVASIPLYAVSGTLLGASIFCYGTGKTIINSSSDGDAGTVIGGVIGTTLMYAMGTIFIISSVVALIPAVTLTIYSTTQLNKIAKNYNQLHAVSLNMNTGIDHIGMTINF